MREKAEVSWRKYVRQLTSALLCPHGDQSHLIQWEVPDSDAMIAAKHAGLQVSDRCMTNLKKPCAT